VVAVRSISALRGDRFVAFLYVQFSSEFASILIPFCIFSTIWGNRLSHLFFTTDWLDSQGHNATFFRVDSHWTPEQKLLQWL
jgi:hypothetical protein